MANSIRSIDPESHLPTVNLLRLLTTSHVLPRTVIASCPMTTRTVDRQLPTDRDYQRVLNRLEHVVSGSSVALTEEKEVEVSLDQEEWRFVRIHTLGRSAPMTVFLGRSKGRVVTYLSVSTQEPRPDNTDLTFTRDVITYSEPTSKLKTPNVYLGIHCLKETCLKLNLRFGKTHRRYHSEPRLTSTLPDLKEFRRDEGKRQALNLRVEEAISKRQAAWAIKYAGKDFIRDNRKFLFRSIDFDRKDTETQRRQTALIRRKQCLKDKKTKALEALNKQEIRANAEKAAKIAAEIRLQIQTQHQFWLLLIYTSISFDAIWSRFYKRKTTIDTANKRMKAAIVLQRCYKKVILTINPKRSVKLRALHSLIFYKNVCGESEKRKIRIMLKTIISSSSEIHSIRNKISSFFSKSTS